MIDKAISIAKRIPRAIWGILVSSCFAYCLIATIASAFSLSYERIPLLRWILVVAIIISLINAYDELFLGWLGVFAAALIVLYCNDYEVRQSFWRFYDVLWQQLRLAYPIVAPFGSPYYIDASVKCTKIFMLLSTFPVLAGSWTSIKGNNAAWSFASAFPFLYISTCVTDRQPDVQYFVVAVALLFYLMLSCALRNREIYVHACLVALVAFLALDVVFFLKPSSYVRSDRALAIYYQLRDYSRSQGWLVSAPSASPDGNPAGASNEEQPSPLSPLGKDVWDSDLGYSDLTRIGPRSMSYRHVMDIAADESKIFYLRGYSYGVYEDNAWHSEESSSAPLSEGLFLANGEADGTLTLRTVDASSILYVPYVPVDVSFGYRENDRYIANPGRMPEETADLLAQDIAHIEELMAKENLGVVDATVRYVKDRASYSRGTPAMPEGRDFVDWFLHDSDTGYCVHFATAGVLLLRMQGIPARYVVGFMAFKGGTDFSPVYEKDAHAWIEWYDGANGWQMADATPSVEERTQSQDEVIPPEQDEEDIPTPETVEESEEPSIEPQEVEEPFVVPTAVYIVLWYGLYQVVVCGLREIWLERCSDKEKVLRRYRLARRLDRQNAKNLSSVAQRARFSNHDLSSKHLLKVLGLYEEIYSGFIHRTWYLMPILPLYRKKHEKQP